MNTKFTALADSSGHTAHRGHDGNVAPATANSHEGHVPVYDSVVLFRYGDHYTTSFMNLSTGKATIKQDKQAHTVTISVKKKTDGMVGVRYGFDVPKGMKVKDYDAQYTLTGSATTDKFVGLTEGTYGGFTHTCTAGIDVSNWKASTGSLTVQSVKLWLVPKDVVVDGAAH
jgi:hypothetical protein